MMALISIAVIASASSLLAAGQQNASDVRIVFYLMSNKKKGSIPITDLRPFSSSDSNSIRLSGTKKGKNMKGKEEFNKCLAALSFLQ